MTKAMNLVSTGLRAIAGFFILVLLAAQTAIVALRYVFSLGWSWATDLLVYLFFLSVLFAGLFVVVKNLSVRVDIFYTGWGDRRRNLVDRAALLFLLFPTMAYATWASFPTMLNSWRLLEASPTIGGLPGYFVLKTCLTLFFGSLALIALVLAFRPSPYEGDEE